MDTAEGSYVSLQKEDLYSPNQEVEANSGLITLKTFEFLLQNAK